MQYYRHFTTGRKGDRLKTLYASFGKAKGYGLFFMLLEMCAEKYNGRNETFVFRTKELVAELEIRSRNLVAMLQLLVSHEVITGLLIDNKTGVIQFQWPQLIEIADDYTKKVRTNSGQKSVKGSPKNKKKNNNKNNSSKGTQTAFEHPTNLQDFKILFSDKIYESWLRLFNDQANWIEQELLNAYEYFYVRKTKPPSASFSGWEKRMSSWLSRGWENASRNQQAQQQPKGRPVDGYTGSAS